MIASVSVVFPVLISILIMVIVKYISRFFKTIFSSVNTVSNEHGGLLVADVLKENKVKFIFTLCGGHISPILIAAEKKNIKVVDVRHEVNAVFAADAVARCSGSIGVAAVTAGPGLTNTITAVKNAQMAESPVLLLGGAAASVLKGRGALQDIDQINVFKPICKLVCTVTRVADIKPMLRYAIKVAQSGVPGPVFVEFPIDTLYPYTLVRKEMGINPNPKNIKQRIVNWYLEYYLKNLFGNAFTSQHEDNNYTVESDAHQVPLIPVPSNSDISQAVSLISKSKKPIMLIGSQAMLPPVPSKQLSEAVHKMNIPTYLGGMARGLLGRYNPINFRQNRRDALQQSDLIILAGAVCDFRLGYGRSLNKKAKIITINRSKSIAIKNSDAFWKPTLVIEGDVGTTLIEISKKIQENNININLTEWIEYLGDKEKKKEEDTESKSEIPPEIHLNPLKVLLKLEKEGLTNESILVADGGDFVGSAAYILRPRGPLKWYDPGAFGTLGVGAGFALGIKLCIPEADVWIIYGDGSLGYTIAEYDTFVRHKIGVVSVVGNDACWSQIAREQVPMFGSNVGCQLDFTEYDKVAEGFGGKGYVLNRDNFDSSANKIFQEAIKFSRQGRPVLINCLIGRSDYRQGSISV